MYVATLPIRTQTECNTGGHWAPKARRAKEQRETTCLVIQSMLPKQKLPDGAFVTVTMTRIAPTSLDVGDNLNSSFKHIRDGIADVIGWDDKDPRYTWKYDQRKGWPKEYAVNVKIEIDLPSE